MTRKRFKKLLMSKGCSRNYAEMYVQYVGSRKPTVAYNTLWSFWNYCREHLLEDAWTSWRNEKVFTLEPKPFHYLYL